MSFYSDDAEEPTLTLASLQPLIGDRKINSILQELHSDVKNNTIKQAVKVMKKADPSPIQKVVSANTTIVKTEVSKVAKTAAKNITIVKQV